MIIIYDTNTKLIVGTKICWTPKMLELVVKDNFQEMRPAKSPSQKVF